MPGGEEQSDGPLYEKVEPSVVMQNCILAILHADVTDSMEALRDASVMGFVYVVDVDEKKRKIRILAPVPGRLPAKPLILGSWPEPVLSLVG
jgi:polyribonucleotide 5'-hydroxyl-kinase